MFLRKAGENWYVCRNPQGSSNKCGRREQKVYRNWFLIKWAGKKSKKQGRMSGILDIGKITLPKEFVGKRIRLKVEVLN